MAKIRKAVVYRECSNIINNGGLGSSFCLVEPERGKRQVLEIMENRVAKFVVPETVVNALLFHCANVDMGFAYDMTYREAVECVKYWMGITKPIPMPKYLGERNESGLCFQRLSFNYFDMPNETPVLDEFMSRCTNADAVKMFVGSLTVENSSLFQYVWMFGSGGEGKGSFGRGLIGIFGSGAVTMTVPRSDSQKQFLAYSLQGKRLCVFPECSNFSFPNDPLFKQLTGKDHIWFEQKGKMGYSGQINCKYMFFSNERTAVHGTDANTRRLIYSEISKPTAIYSSTVYDSLIATEMPSFIIKCRELYLESCPMGEDIKFSDEKTVELLDFNDERFEVLTAKWFEIGDGFTATPVQFQDIKTKERMGTTEYRQWVEYLRNRFGIRSCLTKKNGKVTREWVGIKVNPRDFLTGEPIVT